MKGERAPKLEGISSVRAWLVSVGSDNASDGAALANGQSVQFPDCALSSITGFVAFELSIDLPAVARRFVLNLPVSGVPVGRKAAVIRTVISNREGFAFCGT